MVTNPMDYVDDFVKAGASSFTFHIEAAQGQLYFQVSHCSFSTKRMDLVSYCHWLLVKYLHDHFSMS